MEIKYIRVNIACPICFYAVWEHSYGITKFLLENGADPNMVSPLTSTPDVIEPHLPLEISCYDDYGMN